LGIIVTISHFACEFLSKPLDTSFIYFRAHPTWSCCDVQPGSSTGGNVHGKSALGVEYLEEDKYMACSLLPSLCLSYLSIEPIRVSTDIHKNYCILTGNFRHQCRTTFSGDKDHLRNWINPQRIFPVTRFLSHSQKNTIPGCGWLPESPKSIFFPRR